MRKTKEGTLLKFLKRLKWRYRKNFDQYKAKSYTKKSQKKCSRTFHLEQVIKFLSCNNQSSANFASKYNFTIELNACLLGKLHK